jgi:hypothetical protein
MKRLKLVGKIVAFLKPIVKYPKWYLPYSVFSGIGDTIRSNLPYKKLIIR